MRIPRMNHWPLPISNIFDTKEQVSISPTVLKKKYSVGNLRNIGEDVSFNIENLMGDTVITEMSYISIDGQEVPLTEVIMKNNEKQCIACEIDNSNSLSFPLGRNIEILARNHDLDKNTDHHIAISCNIEPYGYLFLEATNFVLDVSPSWRKIPQKKQANIDLINPSTMYPLKLETDTVEAHQVFNDQNAWEDLQNYCRITRQYENERYLPESIAVINQMKIRSGYVPEEISHQEISGRQLIKQAELINRAPFLIAIKSHAENRDVEGFHKQKRLIEETIQILNLLRRTGNIFRAKKIHTMLGSRAEVDVAWKCFGTIWPAGIDLYAILQELYPAFHARITGQIPVYLEGYMDSLLDRSVNRKSIHGIGRFLVDDNSRFIGLYPVAEVPAKDVTLNSPFISQDQIGRKAIVQRILDDLITISRKDRDKSVVVLDYAGGVGNLSEILLKMVYSFDDVALRARLLNKVKAVVIDLEEGQLEAGRLRFEVMNKKPDLQGIKDRIIFMKGDVTKPLGESQLISIHDKFGIKYYDRPIFMGMTAYTIGALDIQSDHDVTTYAQAMAREVFKQCNKIYAVDFSSPMWRLEDFLRDTARWGKEYLRTVHGMPDPQDEHIPLPPMIALWLALRHGLKCRTISEFVRSMALAPALASHYITAWPGSEGHSAGYSIGECGVMKKPGILSFAKSLQSYGAHVTYKSKVWLVGTLDLGRTSKDNRAWAFIPGWVADFVISENKLGTSGIPHQDRQSFLS
jgi:hypothetical protein